MKDIWLMRTSAASLKQANAFGRTPRPSFLGRAALKQGNMDWC